MPEETPAEKPRVKTWRTVKKELDEATARVAALREKLDAAAQVQLECKAAADAMAAKIQAELTAKPAS